MTPEVKICRVKNGYTISTYDLEPIYVENYTTNALILICNFLRDDLNSAAIDDIIEKLELFGGCMDKETCEEKLYM